MNEHPTGALATALAKVQAALPRLERDRTVEVQQKNGGTYSYSYVTLANLNAAILPLLAEHQLAFVAMPGVGSDGKMAIRYALLHESGERLDGEFPVSGEGGIQMVGGRITYARRYILAALVGVAADEDDESRLASDGAAGTAQRASRPPATTTGRTAARKTASRAAPPPLPGETSGSELITKEQSAKLHAMFNFVGITDRAERMDYTSLAIGRKVSTSNELSKAEASQVIDHLDADIAAMNAESVGGGDGETP